MGKSYHTFNIGSKKFDWSPNVYFNKDVEYNSTCVICFRCFQVYFPLKANVLCKIKTAQIVSAVIIIFFVTFESQWFFTVKVTNSKCDFLYPDYYSSYRHLDAVIYSYMPFALMIIFNVAIIYKMYR